MGNARGPISAFLDKRRWLSPDPSQESVWIAPVIDAPLAGEKHRQRIAPADHRGPDGASDPIFGQVVGRHHQDRRETVVVAIESLAPTIGIVRSEFGRVVACIHGAAVVLKEETRKPTVLAIDPICVRSKMSTGTNCCIAPLDQRIIAPGRRQLARCLPESHEDAVDSARVIELTDQPCSLPNRMLGSAASETERAHGCRQR